MELLPEEIRKQVPALYAQSRSDDPIVFVKLSTSGGEFAWFITEFNHEDNDTCFGFIFEGDEGELNYFSLQYLQEQWPLITFRTVNASKGAIEATASDSTVPIVERDLLFTPKPLSAAKEEYLKHLKLR